MTSYLLQVSLSIALFYLLYIALFRKLTFFRLNRMILLSIPLVSMLLPFIRLRQIDQMAAAYILPVINVGNQNVALNSLQSTEYSFGMILVSLYVIGLTITTMLFLARLFHLYRYLRKLGYVKEDKYKVAVSPGKYSSFSFFNYIIINRKEEHNKSLIIQHEQWHFKMGHSVDNAFLELLKCVFWFNPFVYLLHKELRTVHEYEVDEFLSGSGHKLSYIDEMTDEVMLLKELKLTNPYKSNSNLLNRIKMMYKNRSSSFYKLSYLSVIPIVMLLLFMVSCTKGGEKKQPDQEQAQTEGEIVYTGKESDGLTSMPEFPGGIQELYTFLREEIKYPEKAKKDGLSGKVFVSFVINASGEIVNVKVERGLHPYLDAEALRAVSIMPDWTPGEKDGEKVAVEYMLPIQFTLR